MLEQLSACTHKPRSTRPPWPPATGMILDQPMQPNSAAAAGDVLVVDDNRLNLTAIEAALEGTFVNVVQAQSGDAALRLLLDRDFALILLDVQMPTLDGFETARLIRQRPRTRHTPIIFVTAHSRADAEIRHAYELGAVDFLFKPLVPEVLQAKATVFVNLRMQRLEVERQALLLRDHERKEHERRLEDERRRWEEEALRRQVDEERRTALEISRKADELARTVEELERVRGALTESNRELAASDRRKTEFIAVLAHELRNPLAPIVTSLELIRQTTSSEDAITLKAWQVIERQVAQLGRLVDDLLDVSRITSDKIELRKSSATLSELIDQATATSKPAIDRAGHTLVIDAPEQDVTLHVDPVRIVQVLSNLLNNAARYTERGGEIRLSASSDDNEVLFTVKDNGRGMSPDSLNAIFDMFMQEHRGGGGLGIGLTLVKRLAELHGGTVEAYSAGLGRGSTFVVKLPLGTVEIPECEIVVPEPPASTRPMRIVLVEDNVDIRETVRALLETWGHFVEEASTGPEGAELILLSRPTVALVDVGLPGMDGCEVAKKVRQRFSSREVRLIAMTGYGQDSDRQRIQAAGFDAHLIKPADAKTLQHALSNASLRMGSHDS